MFCICDIFLLIISFVLLTSCKANKIEGYVLDSYPAQAKAKKVKKLVVK